MWIQQQGKKHKKIQYNTIQVYDEILKEIMFFFWHGKVSVKENV